MKHLLHGLIAFTLFVAIGSASAQRITVTLSGNGLAGYADNKVPALQSRLNGPYDICLDAAGNVYYTDMTADSRVRKIDARTGMTTTIAGGGTSMAEGIPATNAVLHTKNICTDPKGNVYAVSSSDQVRKIDAVTHTITTVAGIWRKGYAGDGGPATAATFNNIADICTDKTGNLYVLDRDNSRIRKIDAITQIVTTIAGTGAPTYTGDGGPATDATLAGPLNMAIDNTGNIYFADQDNIPSIFSYIRRIDAKTGVITTIAGEIGGSSYYDAPATAVVLGNVSGLCTNRDGDLYFNEISCSCRKINTRTDTVTAVAGNFYTESFADNCNSQAAYMNWPYGICADTADNLYVADSANNRVRKLIRLTHRPTFAFGPGQTISTCPGTAVPVDTLLSATDIDSAQSETWTVIDAPAHGALSGFPVTVSSMGVAAVTVPAGATYAMSSSYTGTDSFRVQVTDGGLTDTMTVFINLQQPTIDGPNRICLGSSVPMSNYITDGTWSVSDGEILGISPLGVVTGNSAGTATITYTAISPCGVVNAVKTVSVDQPLPYGPGSIIGPFYVCNNSSTTYSDSVAGGTFKSRYDNLTPDGLLTTGASPVVPEITYTLINGCGNSSATTIVSIEYCSKESVAGVSSAASVNIFPSPASSVLNIAWSDLTDKNAIISIADMAGRVVMNTALLTTNGSKGVMPLDVSALKEGNYVLTVNTNTARFSDKILIIRQ